MKKYSLLFLSALVAATCFVSCEKDDDNTPKDVITYTFSATSYSEFVYFSFDSGKVVTIDDPTTSLNWDLGFLRNHTKTNSGSSGSGMGGATDMGAVSLESVKKVSGTIVVDDTIQISDPNDPTHQTMINSPGNVVLDTWGTFDFTGTFPVFNPSNNIFIVKTAAGKYAKVWFKSYYAVDGTSGNITMDYVYLSDGSTSFE